MYRSPIAKVSIDDGLGDKLLQSTKHAILQNRMIQYLSLFKKQKSYRETYRIISPSRKETARAIGQHTRVPGHQVDGVVRKREWNQNSNHGQIVETGRRIVLWMSVYLNGTSGESTVAGIEQVQVASNNSYEKRISDIICDRGENALARGEYVIGVDNHSNARGSEWSFNENLNIEE